MPTTAPSVIFDKTIAAPSVQAAIGRAGQAGLSATSFTADEAWEYLVSAEKDIARRLRVSLAPIVVFAGEPSAAEITALAGAPYLEESGYDYEPALWNMEDWGYLVLRQKPVVSVASVEFVYPSIASGSFVVPPSWIRLDKKSGHLRFVPAGASVMTGAFGAMMISMMAGGRDIPQMIRVRYTAGLSNAASNYPELLDIIKKAATLRAISSAFPAQSGSVSADGLSESSSVDMDKWQDVIDHGINTLRDAIHGVRCVVM